MRKECNKKEKTYKLKVLPELAKLHSKLEPADAFQASQSTFETIPGFNAESGSDENEDGCVGWGHGATRMTF